MALLFEPIQFDQLQLSNRIIIAPMCQYSATEQGEIDYWHEQQWGSYALSGAGLCIVEATAVQPEGRISYADLGLWNDQQRDKMAALLRKIQKISPMPFAIQLAHAGRKASQDKPWLSAEQLASNDPRAWQTLSASALKFAEQDHCPHALNEAEIAGVVKDFADAAQRAVEAGFKLIEIHAAHGYLIHQFLSPLSNIREDRYGGSLENRMRLCLQVFAAVRQRVPQHIAVGIRISAQDWVAGGWSVDESIVLSKHLAALGAAYIHVSSAGLSAQQQIDVGPNYQVPFAAAIKKQVAIPVIAVGLIDDPQQAEQILTQQQADAIAIARGILYDPRWPWHAAAALRHEIAIAPQYLRSQPRHYKALFQAFATKSQT
ncbi:NADH:flavin oxidoreductase/NADH oxidase [Acinetobacter larvae]|uniref:Oxidoreductase n=1 Tax=Acinetobacter larvae TaxID=1789224 RepID=A0A1B2LX51_9GAMM|nr:NADH:flavin oxidoreductase/NADH oxidase [Acinetobacter larvae]AOA57511.1 oxidoreductase [Acinetobacter larvae]